MKNSITKISLVVSVISLLVVGFLALQMHELTTITTSSHKFNL